MAHINLKKVAASCAAGLGGVLLFAAPAAALPGNNTVTSGDIVDGAVHTQDLADNAVTTSKIANGSVGKADIGNDSVGNGELLDSAVSSSKLGDNSVTTSKIANGGVGQADIATDAVGSGEIQSDAVGTDEIATGGVASAEIANGSIVDADISGSADISVQSLAGSYSVTTGTTGSHQAVSGDLTYAGNAGGTSSYHAGVMGNFMGDTLTNTTSSYHAGVIGSYNVTTSDANTGAQAGVVGEVGEAVESGTAAVMAVLGGDTSTLTPDAAYGVQYFNSTAGSHFNYGLDLFHAATADYGSPSAVDYGTADIRLSSGATISTGSAAPTANCSVGSIYLRTGASDEDTLLYTCSATNTWSPADL